jgi:hypothetical protein
MQHQGIHAADVASGVFNATYSDPKAPPELSAAMQSFYDLYADPKLFPGGTTPNWQKYDEAVTALRASWTPEQRMYVDKTLAQNYTPKEHAPEIQELLDTRQKLNDTGFWSQRDSTNEEVIAHFPNLNPQGLSFDDFRAQEIAKYAGAYRQQGLPADQAADAANALWEKSIIAKAAEDRWGIIKGAWANQNLEAAFYARKYDYLSFPKTSVMDARIDAYAKEHGLK